MKGRSIACQQLVELVTDYLEQALSPADRAAVERHLLACDDCSAYLAQMRLVISLSGDLLEPGGDALPDGFVSELVQAFRARQPRRE